MASWETREAVRGDRAPALDEPADPLRRSGARSPVNAVRGNEARTLIPSPGATSAAANWAIAPPAASHVSVEPRSP